MPSLDRCTHLRDDRRALRTLARALLGCTSASSAPHTPPLRAIAIDVQLGMFKGMDELVCSPGLMESGSVAWTFETSYAVVCKHQSPAHKRIKVTDQVEVLRDLASTMKET